MRWNKGRITHARARVVPFTHAQNHALSNGRGMNAVVEGPSKRDFSLKTYLSVVRKSFNCDKVLFLLYLSDPIRRNNGSSDEEDQKAGESRQSL